MQHLTGLEQFIIIFIVFSCWISLNQPRLWWETNYYNEESKKDETRNKKIHEYTLKDLILLPFFLTCYSLFLIIGYATWLLMPLLDFITKKSTSDFLKKILNTPLFKNKT